MHSRRLLFVVAAATLLVACASDTLTLPPQDEASAAVDIFTRLADSVARAGGDADLGDAYSSLADAVRQGGRVSPVVITIDGVATNFLATAQQTEVTTAPCTDPAKCATLIALRPAVMRSLIAWQQDNPKRIVQLSAAADSEPIRAYLYPVLVPFTGPSASLVFFDGKGGTFFGSSGRQAFAMKPSTEVCAATAGGKSSVATVPAPRCTNADFTVSLSAKAEPSTFLAAKNNATGSHTFAMAAQSVLGARVELTAVTTPKPPINVAPSASLSAVLTATVDSLVHLAMKVTNTASTPATVTFASGQQFDFTILDAATGARVWRWSDGKGFTMALGSTTIPANGSVTYTASWKPLQKGNYVALGTLVSMSHRADAKVAVTVP